MRAMCSCISCSHILSIVFDSKLLYQPDIQSKPHVTPPLFHWLYEMMNYYIVFYLLQVPTARFPTWTANLTLKFSTGTAPDTAHPASSP